MDENNSTDAFVARRGVAVGFLSLLSLLPYILSSRRELISERD